MNRAVNFRLGLFGACLLSACASPSESLVVKQFLLRDQEPRSVSEPLVRMEKSRRLHGAVSMEERRQRLGQYYSILWNDPAGAGRGEVELRFEYQQGATGSRIKRAVRRFPATETGGTFDFAVIGDDYFEGGRVLAWKATLLRGSNELATRRSYLWE